MPNVELTGGALAPSSDRRSEVSAMLEPAGIQTAGRAYCLGRRESVGNKELRILAGPAKKLEC